MKKNLMIAVLMMTTFSAFANCDEFQVRTRIENALKATIGEEAGGEDKVMDVKDIMVITTEDEDSVKALYSYKQVIGQEGAESEYSMLGYAKFDAQTCKVLDGLNLGTSAE